VRSCAASVHSTSQTIHARVFVYVCVYSSIDEGVCLAVSHPFCLGGEPRLTCSFWWRRVHTHFVFCSEGRYMHTHTQTCKPTHAHRWQRTTWCHCKTMWIINRRAMTLRISRFGVCMYVYMRTHMYILHIFIYTYSASMWRRPIKCLTWQVYFCKRATIYRALFSENDL